jgi:hypothetical protein
LIPAGLSDWAARWNIPYGAMAELAHLWNLEPTAAVAPHGADEAWVQSKVRLDVARQGLGWLGRNNVGAGKVNGKGFMRWGLANDSEKVNEVCKSADLIGIRHVLIEPHHVGTMIGQFWSLEVKRVGWTYTGQGREPAQANWAALVTAHGGRASFTTGETPL